LAYNSSELRYPKFSEKHTHCLEVPDSYQTIEKLELSSYTYVPLSEFDAT